MSDNRKNRKEILHENLAPINFTCGICNQVHPYNKDLRCIKDDPIEEVVEDSN